MVVLKELILNSFYFQRVWWVLKELFLISFYFERVWWSWKNCFWSVSTFRGCGSLERTDFEQFLLSEGAVVGCGGVVVLKGLTLNSFYFQRVWWSWKNWFWTVSTLGGCGSLERTDFEQFLLSEGVVVMKELILNSFYFQRVWLSWKNSFWTVSTLGGSGDLEWTHFEQFLIWEGLVVLKQLFLNQFLLWEGVVVLKGLILNCFYFQRVWWSWNNSFWTLSTFRGSSGHERTEFSTSFYFGRVWWSWKNSFWTVSTFRGCGGLERTDFEQFLLSEGAVVGCGGVVVLKELILNSFYFGRVW